MIIDDNERLEKDYLNWAPGEIRQLNLDINRRLLYKDYDTVRDYVDCVEKLITRAWKIMEKYPELKSPRIEKFLEESFSEAKESLDRCLRHRNINEEESEQELRARRQRWESIRQYRGREWLQQQPWFSQ